MNETFLRDLGVTFPFDCFAVDVLRTLGVAPTQLHPNEWATMLVSILIVKSGSQNHLSGDRDRMRLSQSKASRPVEAETKTETEIKSKSSQPIQPRQNEYRPTRSRPKVSQH
ncbi:hypothetical protein CR513_24778, partial [Mucuna pruriens]